MVIIRLWHTKLISVLPREQLVSQWRECGSIAASIQKKGTPNHILVNFVLDYDYNHFISYAYYIRKEMTKRGYRTMNSVWDKIIALKPNYDLIPLEEVYKEKMNRFYLQVCYWNLAEKHSCGGITDSDFYVIEQVRNFTNDLGSNIT